MSEIYGGIVHFFTLTSRSILVIFKIYHLRMKTFSVLFLLFNIL